MKEKNSPYVNLLPHLFVPSRQIILIKTSCLRDCTLYFEQCTRKFKQGLYSQKTISFDALEKQWKFYIKKEKFDHLFSQFRIKPPTTLIWFSKKGGRGIHFQEKISFSVNNSSKENVSTVPLNFTLIKHFMSDRCGTSIIRKTLLSERNRIGSEENKRLDHDTSYVRFYKFSRSVSGFKIGWGEYSQAKCEFFFTPSTSLLLKSSIYRPNPTKIKVLL